MRRFVGVRAIVVGEYVAAAAVLVALVYLVDTTTPPESGCVAQCELLYAFGQELFAAASLVLLVVGLPVALLIATVSQRRGRRGTSTRRLTVRPGEVQAATIAAAWGVAIALPLSCILAPVVRLLM